MNCPHCNFRFGALAVVGGGDIPPLAPIACEGCGRVSLLVDGAIRKATPEELREIQQSPAWKEILAPLAKRLRDNPPPPVDRSKVCLSDGSPVTNDFRDIRPDGMQKGYLVLNDEERLRGFVRPYRETYTHLVCGRDTTMGRRIAETYARDPKFYGGTYCAPCGAHFPLDQFVWKGTDIQVGA